MDEVLRRLYETADALARKSAPPVELRKICDDFGIHITRSSSKRPGAKRAFLLQTNDKTEIMLPDTDSDKGSFTTWERFLIAHELGHFYLSRLQPSKPLGAREYWHIEKVCDTFARRLLLPSLEVSAVVSIAGKSAANLLGATLHLQTKWAVPWPVAAHEVAGCAKTVHFFKLISEENRFRVSASTLPDRQQTGRLIPVASSLGSLLRTLPQNSGMPKQVPVERIGDFKPICMAVDAAVCRAGSSEYRIATRLL